jgi:hypothetical protein
MLTFNLAIMIWLVWKRVADLPWISGKPGPTCDFIVRYAAGTMARQGHATGAYVEALFQQTVNEILPTVHGRLLWMHPPPALLPWSPISTLPYEVAYLGWIVLSLALFAVSLQAVVKHRAAWILAPIFAGWTLDFTYAQNGAVLTGVLTMGLLLLRSRPLLSGLFLGYLSIKPHWAPMVVLALVAGRQWRALGGTLAASLALYGLSVPVFGVETWMAWLAKLDQGFKLIPDLQAHDLMSPYSAVLPLGKSVAAVVQTLCTLSASTVVAWVWFRDRRWSTRFATLAVAMSVASPYLHFYDLAVLGVAVAWIARDALDEGDKMHALTLFTLASSAIWLFRIVGAFWEVQVAPLFLMAALYAVARRD